MTTLTGCATAGSNSDAVTYDTNGYFIVELTQSIFEVADLTVGYYNFANTLGPDGRTQNPFYSPDSTFYFDITANIDQIYSKISGRDKLKTPLSEETAKLPRASMPASY